MILLEAWARPLAILHGVAAGVLVGAATHHLLSCRHYLRGVFARAALERRYARVSAVAFLVTFGLGGLLYPTYKVRVRVEYFDAPSAVAAETALRREHSAGGARAAPPVDLSWVGRLFDVKEHWAALGAAAAVALWVLSRRAHPSEHREALVLYVGLSLVVCAAAWTGAIVGLVTTSFRSVGAA